MQQMHAANADCAIHFFECVQIDLRIGLGLGRAAASGSIADAPGVLLRVGEAPHDLYDVSERFLNVAARAGRRSPPGDEGRHDLARTPRCGY